MLRIADEQSNVLQAVERSRNRNDDDRLESRALFLHVESKQQKQKGVLFDRTPQKHSI